MTEVGAPPEPRPVFETSCKPDILDRLTAIALTAGAGTNALTVVPKTDIVDTIEVITGLRESDARRLAQINNLKRELTEARATNSSAGASASNGATDCDPVDAAPPAAPAGDADGAEPRA